MLTKEKKWYKKEEHHPAMPRYHTKENKNCMYYTINRNLGKILSLFHLALKSYLPPSISLLSLLLPSPMDALQLPLLPPQTTTFTPTTLLPPPSFTTARVTVSPTLP